MTLRESNRQNWRRLALVLPPVLIALFAIVICQSTGNGLWAQASKQPPPQKPGTAQPARPAPTPNAVALQRLVSLKTQFVEELNQALQNPEVSPKGDRIQARETVETRFAKDVLDQKATKLQASAKVVHLEHAQLQELRNSVARQIDEAIKLEQAGKGGARFVEGSFSNHVFTGKVRTVAP